MLTLSKELVLEHIGKDGLDKFLPENSKVTFTEEHLNKIKSLLEDKEIEIKLVHFYGVTKDEGLSDTFSFSKVCQKINMTVPVTEKGKFTPDDKITHIKTETKYPTLCDIDSAEELILGRETIHLTVRQIYTGQTEMVESKTNVFAKFDGYDIHIVLQKCYNTTKDVETRVQESDKPLYFLHIYVPPTLNKSEEATE